MTTLMTLRNVQIFPAYASYGSSLLAPRIRDALLIEGRQGEGETIFPAEYRDSLKGLYVVAITFFLLLLNCSAWPSLAPA